VADLWRWMAGWTGVEHLSWVVTAVLLPLGLGQLWLVWREQRRITKELTKQPHLRVGFLGAGGSLEDVVAVVTTWDANTNRSGPIDLRIFSRNVGERTAYNALVNLIFPKGTQIIKSISGPLQPDIELGGWRIYEKQPTVHPDVSNDHTTTLTVDRSLESGFEIGATLSMDHRPTTRQVLKVIFLKAKAEAN
jgi:hypothetical protein